MDEDETPRESAAVLDLAENRLGDEKAEEHRPEPEDSRKRGTKPPQEPPDDEHPDAEGRGNAHVHVDGVDDPEPEPLDVGARPRDEGPRQSPLLP